MSALVIRGGTVVLPTGQRPADIAILDGTITAVGSEVRDGDETIDARNLVVLPGVIDAHVHFNEPGRADWEGWEAGTRGAAAGGVTTVLEMPLNAHPPTTTPAAFDEKLAIASQKALVDFGLWGGLVPDNLDNLQILHQRGVIGFKAFMSHSGIDDFQRVPDGILAIGLKTTARLNAIVGVHAESHETVERLSTGERSSGADRLSWCRARPSRAEVEAIQRLLVCMRGAGRGVRAHVVHVSCAEGLAQVDAARSKGTTITAETCPHYLAFTEEDFERIGPALKCAPPIRDPATREALWAEVLAGRVDLIGSDHSPCPAADKQKGEHDIWQAWGGIAGIQATLPVLLTDGLHARGLSLERIAHLTATAPAQLFGLFPRKGGIAVGADADFAIVDPEQRWTFGSNDLQTRSGVSAYLGRAFTGKVVRTIVRGTTVFVDGEIVGNPGWGQFVKPQPTR
ncbi:MAG: allantoinase [Gemmatimonadetes bacterium 13_1_20CM_4_66_11]|nr:MAG: allantoinase [Gemmatimonadetes bacterium 13_2_20CM_2_66_5]OLD86210.1 MAG: allantoinase [Gemmatimonadetes bacterium 13_1_20CM_4_66_11]